MDEQRLDFSALEALRTACTQADLTIVGGTIQEQDVAAWLNEWNFELLPWQIWEEVSALRLEKGHAMPTEFGLVERGRLFGEGGDLTLRRDGSLFRWHFIGPKAANVQLTPDALDFWQEYPNKMLHRIEQQVILWGVWRKDLGRWHDNRVGWANLKYPPMLEGKSHVYVHYDEYLDLGRVAFVWLRELSGGKS